MMAWKGSYYFGWFIRDGYREFILYILIFEVDRIKTLLWTFLGAFFGLILFWIALDVLKHDEIQWH
jgi:hypothetical protein